MASKARAYRPGHSGYVSEFGRFLDDFKKTHPHVEEDQRRGWYIWWDHNIDLAERDRQSRDEVPPKPYSYD